MSNYFAVNKCGKKLPIYVDADRGAKVIGHLLSREACGFDWDWGGDGVFCHVRFLSTSGELKWGFVIDPPAKGLAPCTDYPYGTVKIDGETYKTFKFRRESTIYDKSGDKIGTIASGLRVACKTALSGTSHPNWKAINYAERASGGWKKITGDGVNYGFVATGLSKGSGPDTISMYGTW